MFFNNGIEVCNSLLKCSKFKILTIIIGNTIQAESSKLASISLDHVLRIYSFEVPICLSSLFTPSIHLNLGLSGLLVVTNLAWSIFIVGLLCSY